jgi:uncharacterized membrane protein YeaQ/YmgE (transglycosylase-associated protein family)
MNKRTVTFIATVGMAVGGYVPILLGWDKTGLDGPSILGGLVGGIVAIWLVVKFSKSLGL